MPECAHGPDRTSFPGRTLHDIDPMTDESNPRDEASRGRTGLAEQMQRLQAYVADAHARGEDIPPEADMMIARLKELVGALDDLTTSMEKPETAGDEGTK